jgi:chromosome condensin MukBEF MukE localization factor
MENENSVYPFLNSDLAKKYFADTDFALKQGRHIQDFGNDHKLFVFIDEYFDKGLQTFYENFFVMKLKREEADRERYYFLDFQEDSKGKFGKENRSKELEDDRLIFGILLLNLYKEKFFEKKEIRWQELEQIFKEGEHKELWQHLLYGKVKHNYSVNEEVEMKAKVVRILKSFEDLGWIYFINQEDIYFEIMISIDRISKLYGDIINNVENLHAYFSNEQLS